MTFRWSEDLSVGVVEIDNQHKELIRRTNDLVNAIAQGKGSEEVVHLVRFLQVYIVSHFALEEQYMQTYRYPASDPHFAEHRKFIQTVFSLRAQLEQEGPIPALVEEVRKTVVDWLQDHITVTDKTFGAFLRSGSSGTMKSGEGKIVLQHVSSTRRYTGGKGEEERMLVEDGVLEEGPHAVALSAGRFTAWLTIEPPLTCRLRSVGDHAPFSIIRDDGSVVDSANGDPVEIAPCTFRLISALEGKRFILDVHPAVS